MSSASGRWFRLTPTIPESVRKTGRPVVVDEDYQSCGVTGEANSRVTDRDADHQPEDPGFRAAQEDLADVLERRNPIFRGDAVVGRPDVVNSRINTMVLRLADDHAAAAGRIHGARGLSAAADRDVPG